MSPMDFTDLFNTELSPADEAKFQAWAKANNRLGDLRDYDMRGAWLANTQQAANGHFPDTYKKPNHPTFSTESIYNGEGGMMGGRWLQGADGGWSYLPSKTNLENYPAPELQRYFQRAEPDSKLLLPQAVQR